MFDPFAAAPRRQDDVVAIPRVWLTFALSVLIHGVALWLIVPRLPLLAPGTEQNQATDQLQVQIAALPSPASAPPPQPSLPAPTRETRTILSAPARPRNAPAPKAPPVLVVPPVEAPKAPPPPPPLPAVAPPAQPAPPVAGDLSSFIASRRQARGESPTPAESDSERRDRMIAASMPATQSPIAGRQIKRGGGLFEITRMAFDDAQFLFFGWNKDAGSRTTQAYDVRLGNNKDMPTAVVRKMIAIIREQEHGDFDWESWRLGRTVTLSARPEDNAGLEEFLLQEMFDVTSKASSR
jgi:hypothetical protein